MDPLFPDIPEDFGALDAAALDAYIAEAQAAVEAVCADPSAHVGDALTTAQLLDRTAETVASIEVAREALAALEPAPVELSADEAAEQFAELAARAVLANEEPEPDDDPDPDPDPDPVNADEPEAALAVVEAPEPAEPEAEPVVPEVEAAVVASAPPARPAPLARPARARSAVPQPEAAPRIALTAALEGLGYAIGAELTPLELAEMMITRRDSFGNIAPGTSGEKIGIARANWRGLYPAERRLTLDHERTSALIAAAIDQAAMRAEFERRRGDALVASGGLCAPVTPYYQLQMLSVAERPVRAALTAFNADRGGIRFGRPAALTAIDDAIGLRTAAQDAAGGSEAVKSCQVIDCPAFEESDVNVIYHCLQFGNLGARTFPELVQQWNALVLAAHARLAESTLLTNIDTASTQVTAASLGLGAVGDLLGQVLAAAAGMRSRHRMAPDAILRLMMPRWALPLMVSDVIRSQFQRFDTDEQRIVAKLREFNVEPTFYLDGAAGAAQVFGAQGAGALLAFPPTVNWFIYPEGSFLFLDGGTLELGLVRDSVLNESNDFQLFGETFENVAFIGVESLSITSTTCDSGAVTAPVTVTDCGDYGA